MAEEKNSSALASHELYAALIEEAPFGVIVYHLTDPGDPSSLMLIAANRAASSLMSRDLRAACGKLMREIFPSVTDETHRRYADIALGVKREVFFRPYSDATTRDRTFRITAVSVPVRCVGMMLEDITREEISGRSVSDLNTFLESIIENIPNMVFVKDADKLRFERLNRAGEELLGVSREQMLGKSDYDFFPKEQADFFTEKDREVLRKGELLDIPEEVIQTPRGPRWLHTRKIPVRDSSGAPRHLLGISWDITELRDAAAAQLRAREDLEVRVRERTAELAKANVELTQQIADRRRAEEALQRSEEQLRHSQKMEAIGLLAGGIAHDFNNLLSVILSYTEMMMEDLDGADPLQIDLGEVKKAGDRAAALTRQLLAFSRQQVMEPKIVDLNDVITNMDKMLRRMLGEDIELFTQPEPELGTVRVDPGQIEQVIMNLVVNARDAMPQGGKLTIETANVQLDDAFARAHLGINAGPHVMIAVSDTGHGMDKATQARVFEPFFTTKQLGKGTGLGLSTVFGIVKQSNGSIWLYSEVGRGTTFKIYFPRIEGQVAPEPERFARSLRGTETVLLVEDEDQVRVLARSILEKQGYRVLEARNGGEAQLVYQANAAAIDLLLTDVVMPQVSGPKLAERLLAERPGLRVLFMSGYTDSAIVHHGVLEAGMAFLQKPLTPDALARKVREVLDSPPPPPLSLPS